MLISAFAQLFLDGNLQAFVMMTATVLTGASAYVWKYYVEPYFSRRRITDERTAFYREARTTLVKMRKQRGLSAESKQELNRHIAELDQVFMASVIERVKARLLEIDEAVDGTK